MVKANEQPFSKRIPWSGVVIILVGILLLVWLYLTPPGLFGKADAIGYSVCHQIDLRSFHIGERQFPLCARCTGQFLGVRCWRSDTRPWWAGAAWAGLPGA